MRFIKHHLESILGVEIYPILSLLIFFLFFVALTWYVVRADKGYISYMENRPLDLPGTEGLEDDLKLKGDKQ